VRTPNVSRYVAEEIVPRFERRPVTTVPPRSVLHRAGRAVPPDEAPAPHPSSSRPRRSPEDAAALKPEADPRHSRLRRSLQSEQEGR